MMGKVFSITFLRMDECVNVYLLGVGEVNFISILLIGAQMKSKRALDPNLVANPKYYLIPEEQ